MAPIGAAKRLNLRRGMLRTYLVLGGCWSVIGMWLVFTGRSMPPWLDGWAVVRVSTVDVEWDGTKWVPAPPPGYVLDAPAPNVPGGTFAGLGGIDAKPEAVRPAVKPSASGGTFAGLGGIDANEPGAAPSPLSRLGTVYESTAAPLRFPSFSGWEPSVWLWAVALSLALPLSVYAGLFILLPWIADGFRQDSN